MKFLILGLPRSRTAWLANFLTFDGNFCYHEGINGCSDIKEYKEKMEGKGDSNTGLVFFKYQDYFPDVKTIIIDSDINVEFGKDVFNANTQSVEIMRKAKKRLDGISGLHIKLTDINIRLKDIWDYVSPKKFNKERADMLIKMNVQVVDPLDFDLDAIKSFNSQEGLLCL